MDAQQSSYTFSNPALTATPLDFSMLTPPATDVPTTIKMEDLHQASSPAAVAEAATPAPTQASNHKSGPKKRKSWGQVLPEPKTNLPPRKRAKTADEKEQRRIERVKRNRLAAHNSRERKREEMERLTSERDHYRDSLDRFFTYTKQLEDQISWYRTRTSEHLPDVPRIIDGIEMPPPFSFSPEPSPAPTSAPSSTSANAATTSTPTIMTTSADSVAMTREGSVASTTINPREASFTSPAMNAESSFDSPAMNQSSYASPESMEDYDSPVNSSSQPPTPRTDGELSFVEPDQTQHSAAMLCDLQCRSAHSSASSSTPPESLSTFPWAITYLILLNLRLSSMTLLSSSICQHIFLTIQRAASSMPLSPKTQWDPSTFTSTLLQSLMTCTPTQAQQFLLATGLAPLRKPSFRVAGKVSGSSGILRERETRRTVRQLRRLSSSFERQIRRQGRGSPVQVREGGHHWDDGFRQHNLTARA